ncbi:MAG TPA: M23 family metallopeptidase [Nocardioides sp.]|uniref:M23 family metallopeptidase n=1 Tax=Nocardioides sp. TaxID=35761 RepID=UPI002EDA5565
MSATAVPTRRPGSIVVVLLAGLVLALVPASAGASDPAGVWPLSPRPEVARGFAAPDEPWGPGHRGVDLRGTVGQRVVAALAGVVTYAGLLAGRGVVVVDHGSTRTTYEPVSAVVRTGDTVTAGAAIGLLTATRSHCFPAACLHWGLIRNADDVYLDPLSLVGAVPVRLLPLWREQPVGPPSRPASPYAGWRPLVRLLEMSGRD